MWTIPENFKVKLGGNYYINVQNLIVQNEENIFTLKRRDEDGKLAIDFDIYDAQLKKVATVRNASVVQHDSQSYTARKEQNRYWVEEDSNGKIILEILLRERAEGDCELEVTVDLYTKSGFHLIAGPETTNIGGIAMTAGCTIEGAQYGVVIG